MRKFYFLKRRVALSSRLLALSALFIGASSTTSAQGLNSALNYNSTPVNPVNGLPNNQYLQLPSGVVQPLSGSFTIEAWVFWRGKANNSISTSDQFQRIFDFGTAGDPVSSAWMFLTPYSTFGGTGVMFAISTNGLTSPQYIISASPLTTNTWHHVAVTLNNATSIATIYVDGVSVASGTITLRPSNLGTTTRNYLGESNFPQDASFNGFIDEFRISNTVRYNSNFTPSTTIFSPDANTRLLYHFSEGGGQTTADASGNGLTGILGFSTAVEPDLDPEWTANAALPVSMEWFNVKASGRAAELKWRASTTGEGGDFIIERSTDGRTFQSIGKVDITSNTGSFEYSFRDAAPAGGKNYYRIRIAEVNAKEKLSEIVWIDFANASVYSVHPTLASSSIFVSLPEASTISIYDASGRMVKRMKLSGSQQVSVSELNRGMYHVLVEEANKTIRFVKQ